MGFRHRGHHFRDVAAWLTCRQRHGSARGDHSYGCADAGSQTGELAHHGGAPLQEDWSLSTRANGHHLRLEDAAVSGNGRNVVIHEFAHHGLRTRQCYRSETNPCQPSCTTPDLTASFAEIALANVIREFPRVGSRDGRGSDVRAADLHPRSTAA